MILPFYHITIAYISHNILSYYTSSTAQGGGGSFKNRKPIGEVSCCDAWMAEQTHWWTDRWLGAWISLSFSPYLSISLSLSFFPLCHFCPSIYLSIHPSIYLSIYPSNIQNAAILRLRHVLRATTACTFSTSQLPTPWTATFSRTCIFFPPTLSLPWSCFFLSLLWLFWSLLFICPYCQKFDF